MTMEALRKITGTSLAMIALVVVFMTVGSVLSDALLGPTLATDGYGRRYWMYLFSPDGPKLALWFFLTIIGDAGFPLIVNQLSSNAPDVSSLVRFLAVLLLSIGASVAFLWARRPLADPVLRSGIPMRKYGNAIKAARRNFRSMRKQQGHIPVKPIFLAPEVPFTGDQETRGVLIEGGVGSGKTIIMRYLMNQAIARGDKVIIYDVKGDYAPSVKNRILLNPFAKNSASWNIAHDIQTPEQARQLAAMLVPKPIQGDQFWSSAAQIFMSGIFIVLVRTQPGKWTFLDVYRLLCRPVKELVALFETYYPPATKIVQGGGGNMETGVVATVVSQVMPFIEPLALAWGRGASSEQGVSLRDWLTDLGSTPNAVVLQGSPEHQDAAATWIRMAINLMAGVVLSPEVEDYGSQRIWFFIDEMPSLGAIARLTDIVDRGRSKGVRTVMACQSLYQLEPLYGDWTKAADSNFGIRIVGRMQPSQRSRDICNFFGEQIYVTPQVQVTTSHNGRAVTKRLEQSRIPVLTADILVSLGPLPGRGVDAIVTGLTGNILILNWPFPPKQKPYHPGFEPAAFDWSILTAHSDMQTETKPSVAKTVRAKLDMAIEGFDAPGPTS